MMPTIPKSRHGVCDVSCDPSYLAASTGIREKSRASGLGRLLR